MNAHRSSNIADITEENCTCLVDRMENEFTNLNARLIEIKLKQKFRFISKTCVPYTRSGKKIEKRKKCSVCTLSNNVPRFMCRIDWWNGTVWMYEYDWVFASTTMDCCQNNALFWTASVCNWNGVEGIFYLAGQFSIFYSLYVWICFFSLLLFRELVFVLYSYDDDDVHQE